MKVKSEDYYNYLLNPDALKKEQEECREKVNDIEEKIDVLQQQIREYIDEQDSLNSRHNSLDNVVAAARESLFGGDYNQIPVIQRSPNCYGTEKKFYSPLVEFPWWVQVYFANKKGWSVSGFQDGKSWYTKPLKREYVPTKQEAIDLAVRWIQNRELENLA